MRPHTHDPLASLLEARSIRTLFQPIVELDSGDTLGFEALTRGPHGDPLEYPDVLFDAARARGRAHELDVLCQVAAIRTAVAGQLTHPRWLFVNVEPETLGQPVRELLEAYAEAARATLPLVVEVTERSLTARPSELLRSLEQVRATGARIAMDDVGADLRALALLPLVRPDVIKLDLHLVQQQPSRAIARIVNAVNAEAGRSGAAVLAEGIETEEHLSTALALGATLGQGWLFGRPGPLPDRPELGTIGTGLRQVTPLPPPPATPFEICSEGPRPRIARKELLIEMSKHLEAEALASGELGVLLSTFQEARNLTPDTVRRYRLLADRLAFVSAIGEDLTAEPIPGVRGAVLRPSDPVRGEWDVVVVGPHFAAALTAKDLGDGGPDRERRFQFAVTYDRDRVLAAARSLLERVWATPGEVLTTTFGRPSAPLAPASTVGRPMPLIGPSSLHLRALAATVNGVTISEVAGADDPLVYVNEGFERLTGYSADELVGRNCRFLQGPDTDPAAVRALSRAVRSGEGGRVRILNYRADGTPWWNDLTISPVRDDAGVLTHFIGVQTDVTAEVEAEQRLNHLAFHDELTGLPNRRALFDALGTDLGGLDGTGRALAVLFVDLDDFKAINDAAGHEQGDEVLCTVARRLRRVVRTDDLVARQHGDEFVVVLRDLTGDAAQAAARVAEEALRVLDGPIPHGNDTVTVSASVGVALAPSDGSDAAGLLGAADQAMYAAKVAGKHRIGFASEVALGATEEVG